MADEFVGDPSPLQVEDYERAAAELQCSVAALRAVAAVESAGVGFLPDRRPKLLFERHVFHARTAGRYGAEHPEVSAARRGGYQGGAREYDRLRKAIDLDRRAALESASWGRFQIMGFNHRAAGHPDVEDFVAAMVSGEVAHLAAFVAFVRSRGLVDELAQRDWSGFARGYNGNAFARNDYDVKIASAYNRFAREEGTRSLRQGDSGREVMRLQSMLGQTADGMFGPVTKAALVAFQKLMKLDADGIAGSATWRALSYRS